MLQSIHDNAKGWIAYLIVILISVPFALWGIQEYIGGGGKNIVAEVNGEDIELQAVQNEVNQQRQRIVSMFGKIPPGFDEKTLKRSALENLVNRELLNQHGKKHGYRASTQEVLDLIKTIPQFQKDGQFDADLYHQVMAAQRRSEASFEQQLRDSLSDDQFRNAIADLAFLPKSEMEYYQTLSQQKRDIELYTLKLEDVTRDIQISDEMIESDYKTHPELFQTDEFVKIAYVEINESAINQSVEVSDELLQAHYDENNDPYFEAAKFKMSHIKVSITDTQSDEQALAKADSIYNQINSGEKSFAEIASSTADDTLFSELGEAVGFLKKGSVDAAIEDAVFSAKSGDLIKPVKTSTGYEIIKVLEIVAENQKPFAQAKADVEKDYRRKISTERYENLLEELRTTSFENDGSLQPSATAIDAEIKTTDFFSRKSRAKVGTNGETGGTTITANPKVINAAFSPEVLSQGVNSSLIELSPSHAVVIRLDAHKKSELKPMSEVREAIVTRLKKEQGRKLLNTKGDDLLASLSKAGNWEALGDAATTIEKHIDVSREDNKVPPYVVIKTFQLSQGTSGQPSFSGIESPEGDYSIIALKAVKNGDAKLDEAAIAQYSSYIGNREQTATLKALREQADVEIYLDRLESE